VPRENRRDYIRLRRYDRITLQNAEGTSDKLTPLSKATCRPIVTDPPSYAEKRLRKLEVHVTARDLNGNVLFDEKAGHVFQIEDGLIRRFDIRK
jgi:hypothetical protein